jgi:hypothetical protein
VGAAKVWTVVLVVFLASCVNGPIDERNQYPKGEYGVIYKRGDRQSEIQCQGGKIPSMCGSIEATGQQTYYDCSERQFDCVFDGINVFAAPTSGFSAGQQFHVFGAILSVKRCFGDQATCDIAVVTSACAEARICRCRSPGNGAKATFYFSREFGIVNFNSTADLSDLGVDAAMKADAVPLLTYVLVADKGFLRMPLALPKVTRRTNCSEPTKSQE